MYDVNGLPPIATSTRRADWLGVTVTDRGSIASDAAGADVVPTGRRRDGVEEVAAAIEQRGRRTLRHPADVTSLSSLEALRHACLDAFGHVDIVVAAAGITKRVATVDMAEADWHR